MWARFLAHLGDDATPERVLLADRAAKLVVRIGALEREAERRHLTAAEVDVLGEERLAPAVLVCRLRIEPVARRANGA